MKYYLLTTNHGLYISCDKKSLRKVGGKGFIDEFDNFKVNPGVGSVCVNAWETESPWIDMDVRAWWKSYDVIELKDYAVNYNEYHTCIWSNRFTDVSTLKGNFRDEIVGDEDVYFMITLW